MSSTLVVFRLAIQLNTCAIEALGMLAGLSMYMTSMSQIEARAGLRCGVGGNLNLLQSSNPLGEDAHLWATKFHALS